MKKEIEHKWEYEWEREMEIERYHPKYVSKERILVEIAIVFAALMLNIFFAEDRSSYLMIAGTIFFIVDEISESWIHSKEGAYICAAARVGGVAFFVAAMLVLKFADLSLRVVGAIVVAISGGYRLYQLYGLIKLGYFTKEKQKR